MFERGAGVGGLKRGQHYGSHHPHSSHPSRGNAACPVWLWGHPLGHPPACRQTVHLHGLSAGSSLKRKTTPTFLRDISRSRRMKDGVQNKGAQERDTSACEETLPELGVASGSCSSGKGGAGRLPRSNSAMVGKAWIDKTVLSRPLIPVQYFSLCW